MAPTIKKPKKFPVRGLRIDVDLKLSFQPSIGLSARRMETFGIGIKSFREPLKRSIQQVLAPSFRKNFEAQGRPVSWEPLAEYSKERRGSSEPILERSGLLKRTIQQFNIWTVDQEKAAIVDLPSKIWYGKLQQAGHAGLGDSAPMPARPFVLIQDPEDYDAIEEVFFRWLQERALASKAFTASSGGR